MIFRAQDYKKFGFGLPQLNGMLLEEVQTYTYLGHILTNDYTDHADVIRQCHYLYAVGISLIRKFYFCSV